MAKETTRSDTVIWPEDSTRINIAEEADVQFWSRRFRISVGKLKQAVRAVGPRFKDISHYLNYQRSQAAGS
jgi:hypothetical protein